MRHDPAYAIAGASPWCVDAEMMVVSRYLYTSPATRERACLGPGPGGGSRRRARANRTALTRVASLRDLSHFVGEVYDEGTFGWLWLTAALDTRGSAVSSASQDTVAGGHRFLEYHVSRSGSEVDRGVEVTIGV
jgi:hypothetical protein